MCNAIEGLGSYSSNKMDAFIYFTHFIDNFDEAITEELRDQAMMCKYADDCTLFECIHIGSPSNLQRVLDNLQSWTEGK